MNRQHQRKIDSSIDYFSLSGSRVCVDQHEAVTALALAGYKQDFS